MLHMPAAAASTGARADARRGTAPVEPVATGDGVVCGAELVLFLALVSLLAHQKRLIRPNDEHALVFWFPTLGHGLSPHGD